MLCSDVIVIGIGALGSSVCKYLSDRGLRVLGIDRFSPPHQEGSSGGSTRLFRQAYFEDIRYIPLAQSSYELWKSLESESGQKLLSETGFLVMGPEREDVSAKILNSAKSFGISVETMSPDHIQNQFPQFSVPQGFVGHLEVRSGILRPEKAIETCILLARNNGASFSFNERVISWSSDGKRIEIVTDRDKYSAQHLVLAPGAWTPELGVSIPMKFEITRAPQFWFEAPDSFSIDKNMPAFAFVENGKFIYGFPKIDEYGIKVANYAPSYSVSNPSEGFSEYTRTEIKPIAQALAKYFPRISNTPSKWKKCFYTLTQDENFLIDLHPEFKNVVLATGGSGHAFKFSPIIGDLVSKMICGEELGHNIDFLRFR